MRHGSLYSCFSTNLAKETQQRINGKSFVGSGHIKPQIKNHRVTLSQSRIGEGTNDPKKGVRYLARKMKIELLRN
jgi:hypothetical protein